MRERKYIYLRVMQELSDDGSWCDSEFADRNDKEDIKRLKQSAHDYRREGIIIRFVNRRIPNDGRKLDLCSI